MTDKEIKNLADKIGVPALLEQLAEECLELGHASEKYARYLRDENPVVGHSEIELKHNIEEEMGDVLVIMREVRKVPDLIDNERVAESIDFKRKRMCERLGIQADSFIF